MTNYQKQLEKLIKDKKNQFFDDINDTTGQGSFIGHCIILGYELGLKAQTQEFKKIIKEVFSKTDFPSKKELKEEILKKL